MRDGRTPEPGGWNRVHFIVDDIAAEVERLRAAGIGFRNDIVTGPGGRQILLEDPPATRSSSSRPRQGPRLSRARRGGAAPGTGEV